MFKPGIRDKVVNYRPIGIIPVLSRVFEKLMYKGLVKYLIKHNILTDYQFVFKSQFDISDAVIQFLNNAQHCYKLKKIVAVFLDFSKAFHTVHREIQLNELYIYGVRGITLHWFRSYLENRKIQVSNGEHCSTFYDLDIGVPQGCVFDPLLFLIYINGMLKTCR